MSRLTRTLRGSAAAHGGEAQPHRRASMNREGAAPPWVEAQPRRCKSKLISGSRRLTAMCGGRAAKASSYFTGQITILFCRPYGTPRKSRPLIPAMNRWAIFIASLRDAFFFRMLATNRALLTVFLLSVYCLLPAEITPSLTAGLLPRFLRLTARRRPRLCADPSLPQWPGCCSALLTPDF